MSAYYQFCPVSKAMELLDERWTVLVVRELLQGSRHFNELRRGVPRMSPALLSKRLRTLAHYGIVVRREDGERSCYELTAAGRDLGPVVMAIGGWAVRWMPELGDDDLDPHLLMWDIHRNLELDALPNGRTVIGFCFPDVRGRTCQWWVVITDGDVDLCDADPGHPADVTLVGDLRDVVHLWRGDVPWAQALRAGTVTVSGSRAACRALPTWLRLSPFAAVAREQLAGI